VGKAAGICREDGFGEGGPAYDSLSSENRRGMGGVKWGGEKFFFK